MVANKFEGSRRDTIEVPHRHLARIAEKNHKKSHSVKFEVLTAVVMKSAIFWDIMPCNPLKVNRRFGGTYRFHLRALLATCFRAGFLLGLFFYPEDEGHMFLRNDG
jgi:hypothetical protein